MKFLQKSWPYIKGFAVFVFALWFASYLTTKYKDFLENFAKMLLPGTGQNILTDPKNVVTLVSYVVAYAIFLVEQAIFGLVSGVPWIRAKIDEKSKFIGTYLSLPPNDDELNVFRIEFDSSAGGYKLTGYAWSLTDKGRLLGDWKGIGTLEMKTTETVAVLNYMYEGQRDQRPVRGLVYIRFTDKKPERSQKGSYWLDVSSDGSSMQMTPSKYFKVTEEIKSVIIPSRFVRRFPYIRYFVKDPKTIYEQWFKHQPSLKTNPMFKRPDTCSVQLGVSKQ